MRIRQGPNEVACLAERHMRHPGSGKVSPCEGNSHGGGRNLSQKCVSTQIERVSDRSSPQCAARAMYRMHSGRILSLWICSIDNPLRAKQVGAVY